MYLLDSNTCIQFLNGRSTHLTHNTREFSRVSGLSIEDWELP